MFPLADIDLMCALGFWEPLSSEGSREFPPLARYALGLGRAVTTLRHVRKNADGDKSWRLSTAEVSTSNSSFNDTKLILFKL